MVLRRILRPGLLAPFVMGGVLCLLLAVPLAARGDQGDEDLLDLDALGSFDAPAEKPSESAGFAGGNALFSGRLITKAAHDLRRDNDDEFLFSELTYASAKAAVTVSPRLAVVLEGLFEYEVQTDWEDTQAAYKFILWSGKAKWSLGPVDLTVGQQHVSWGLADVINPTDLINPRDYDRFLDLELGYTKLPAPMARLEWYLPKSLKIDVVALPFFVPARFHVVEADVALFAHDFPLFYVLNQVRSNPDWYRVERALDLWYPGWEEDLDALLEDQNFFDVRTRHLDDDFTHAEGALRFSGKAGSVDFSTSYFYLWDDIPTLHLNPAFTDLIGAMATTPAGYTPIPRPRDIDPAVILEPFTIAYHRTHAIGADVGTSLEGFGLRAEGVYTFAKYTYTENLGTRTRPVLDAVLNVDYTFSDNTLISAAYLASAMLNYDNQMLMPPTLSLAMLAFRRPWLDEKLTTELAAIYDFSYMTPEKWQEGSLFGEDGMVAPIVTYAITDPLKVSVGANVLFGERFQLLGALRDATRAFVSLKYDF